MSNMKRVLLVPVALALALTAAAAFAQGDWGFREGHREERGEHAERFRGGPREEWREQREHERRERWEHRRFGFFSPAPNFAPYCYTQDGYWAWDGWQYMWVPPQTVCQ